MAIFAFVLLGRGLFLSFQHSGRAVMVGLSAEPFVGAVLFLQLRMDTDTQQAGLT
jgi:hypothetical protein